MTPYIKPALIAISLFGAFAAGWSWNGSRHETIIATIRQEQAQAQAEFTSQARAKEQAHAKQLNEARNEATKRETQLRADADRARTAAGGLRDELAAIRRGLPSLAADACREQADRLADVFGSCATIYSELAEQADRLNSERQELIEAWPE